MREESRHLWLAGQIDEVESRLATSVDSLASEMHKLRQVLTGLLISIIVALVAIPIGVIIQVATG